MLACIGPEVRFTTALVEVEIRCDAGTAAAYSAAYGVADREAEAERLYTATLEREVAEAWLSLGVFPDAVSLPAKPVRGVLGLAALAYAAVLSEAPELLGPTQAQAIAWLNEVVWESLRRLDQNGQVTFEEVASIGTEFLAGVLDVSAVVHAQFDTLYPQVAGLLGFSRFEAENLVQNGQPVVLDTQPPQPVQGLVVSPRPQGAVLRWQPTVLLGLGGTAAQADQDRVATALHHGYVGAQYLALEFDRQGGGKDSLEGDLGGFEVGLTLTPRLRGSLGLAVLAGPDIVLTPHVDVDGYQIQLAARDGERIYSHIGYGGGWRIDYAPTARFALTLDATVQRMTRAEVEREVPREFGGGDITLGLDDQWQWRGSVQGAYALTPRLSVFGRYQYTRFEYGESNQNSLVVEPGQEVSGHGFAAGVQLTF